MQADLQADITRVERCALALPDIDSKVKVEHEARAALEQRKPQLATLLQLCHLELILQIINTIQHKVDILILL